MKHQLVLAGKKLRLNIFSFLNGGGVRSKKFEQISPKICRAGGIPPKPPFRPPAEATLSDWTISSFSLAVNSF